MARHAQYDDDRNPKYAIKTMDTFTLSKVVRGLIDLTEFAREELRRRGLDDDGKWMGFEGDLHLASDLGAAVRDICPDIDPDYITDDWCRGEMHRLGVTRYEDVTRDLVDVIAYRAAENYITETNEREGV